MIHTSQTFDLFIPRRFLDLTAGETPPPLPPRVRGLITYLDGMVATPAKVRQWLRHLMRSEKQWDVVVLESGLIAVRLGPDPLAVLSCSHEVEGEPVCEVCGCTRDLGCWGGKGCRWAEPGLCSHCADLFKPDLALHRGEHDGCV